MDEFRRGAAARDRLLPNARSGVVPELRTMAIFCAGIAAAARPVPILDRRPDLSPWAR